MRSSLFLSTWAFALATAGSLNRKACTITHTSGFNGGKNPAHSGPYSYPYSYQFNDTYGSWPRGYSVYIPKDYPSTLGKKEWPVIFDFHGANQDAKKQWQNSQYSLSDEGQKYIGVYPEGYTRDGSDQSWQGPTVSPASKAQPDDLAFVNDVLTKVNSDFCIDINRVYASGKSQGGGLVDELACSNLGDQFAAFAMAAPALYYEGKTAQPANSCSTKRRAILEAHGLKDATADYAGNADKGGGPIPEISNFTERWTRRTCALDYSNGNNSVTPAGNIYQAWNCSGYVNIVAHWILPQGGHCWPASNRNSDADPQNYDQSHRTDCDDNSLNFTSSVLSFFKQWNLNNLPPSGKAA